MSFVCVLPSVDSGGGPDLLLTTDSGSPVFVYQSSVLVHASEPGNFGYISRGCKSYIGGSKYQKKKYLSYSTLYTSTLVILFNYTQVYPRLVTS